MEAGDTQKHLEGLIAACVAAESGVPYGVGALLRLDAGNADYKLATHMQHKAPGKLAISIRAAMQ